MGRVIGIYTTNPPPLGPPGINCREENSQVLLFFLFFRFETKTNGNMDANQFQQALTAKGYRL